jgi:DNA-binding transcriptional LysR family regulator
MDYFGLKCFVEVVRCKSFSKAAQKLFRSQPAISIQLKNLEKELRQPLIDRYKKKISLTEAGKLLYPDALELLERIEDVKRLASHSVSQPEGELAIASNLSLINNFLPPFIGEFHLRYPKVRISLKNLTAKGIAEQILEGNVELGLGFLPERIPEIENTKIMSSQFLLICKKGPAWEKKTFSQIRESACLHFEAGIDLRGYIGQSLGPKNALNITMELPSIESLLQYVKSGLGFTILPEFAVTAEWKNKLSTRNISGLIPAIEITASIHKKRILSKSAREFLKILAKR